MPLQRIAPPGELAVTAAYVKSHTRIDTDADDDFLENLLIPAAIELAEQTLRRSFITQTWELTLDSFPGPSLMGVPYGVGYSLPGHAIILEKPPIQSVTAMTYTALDGTTGTVLPTIPGTGLPTGGTFNFVDLTYGGTKRVDDLLRLTPPYGQIWPVMLPQIGSVVVDFVTGYGDSEEDVPAPIKQWIAMNVATIYENRERCVVGTRVTVSELPYVDRLMDPYVVHLY